MCLKACSEGKLFDTGLQYILSWKQDATEIENLEQEFLERCALHFHNSGDSRSMMKSIKSFRTVDLKRNFLKSLNCLDELLLLEEEEGNFLEAAKIAKSKGNLLRLADLLGKAGNFSEASMLLLHYVLANSLWSPGSKGWPLKQFQQKQELLAKAKLLAENDSRNLYDSVRTEVDILSDENGNLETLSGYLIASKEHNSVRGEMICLRKIMDVHFHLNSSKYTWEDELVFDLTKHSEGIVSKNQVSIETLVYFWHCWKDRVSNVLECCNCLAMNDSDPYAEFCLSFFGIWRLNNNHILLNSDADWVKKVDERFLHRNGKLVSIDAAQFSLSVMNYWSTELLTSGIKVLENLDYLHNLSNRSKFSMFRRCRVLTHMFEVVKFLLESKYLKHGFHDKRMLERYLKMATGEIQSYLFPPDWQVSLKKNVISLRVNSVCQNMMSEIIAENVGLWNLLTYGQIGRVAMMILGSGKLDKKLCEKIVKWLEENPPWSAFIMELFNSMNAENEGMRNPAKEMSLVWRFHEALRDTYDANWVQVRDYISPFCFMYLVERLLVMVSSLKGGYFITTKASFVEWLIFHEGNSIITSISGARTQHSFQATLRFLAGILTQFLFDKIATLDWMRKTHPNVKEYYPVLVQKLVVAICLLHLNFGICFDVLQNLRGRNYITEHLPWNFYNALRRKKNFHVPPTNDANMMAAFFKEIGNPMVIVSLDGNRQQFICRDATFVNLNISHQIDDLLKALFPKEVETMQHRAEAPKAQDGNSTNTNTRQMPSSKSCDLGIVTQLPSSSSSLALDENKKMKSDCEKLVTFWETLEALTRLIENKSDQKFILSNASQIKVTVTVLIIFSTFYESSESI